MIARIWTLAGEDEVFEKEVVSRAEKYFQIYESFRRKGLGIYPFTTN